MCDLHIVKTWSYLLATRWLFGHQFTHKIFFVHTVRTAITSACLETGKVATGDLLRKSFHVTTF